MKSAEVTLIVDGKSFQEISLREEGGVMFTLCSSSSEDVLLLTSCLT